MRNKHIKIYTVSLLISVTLLFACGEDDFVTYEDESTPQAVVDPYLQLITPVVSFQAGIPSYGIGIKVVNGVKKLKTVKVISTYTDALTQTTADPVLVTELEVSDALTDSIIDSLTYDDLKKGVMIDGAGLPEDQTALAVGSGWALKFEGIGEDGSTIPLGGTINVGVLSRFAGLYRTVRTAYFRIGVESGLTDWSGQTRFIGSVNDSTFSYNDFWGPFGWTGSSFNFVIDFDDNTITTPLINSSGFFSGNRTLTCAADGAILQNVPCEMSNVLIPDETTGKHKIIMTYGYFTDGSGPREFFEELEKIVE